MNVEGLKGESDAMGEQVDALSSELVEADRTIRRLTAEVDRLQTEVIKVTSDWEFRGLRISEEARLRDEALVLAVEAEAVIEKMRAWYREIPDDREELDLSDLVDILDAAPSSVLAVRDAQVRAETLRLAATSIRADARLEFVDPTRANVFELASRLDAAAEQIGGQS